MLPNIELIDIRHKKLDGGCSAALLAKVSKHLAQGNQVLIFLNRRGYAPTYMCYQCSDIAQCERCDAKLIVHHGRNRLICHHCDKIYPKPESCPQCDQPMHSVGVGTEKLEDTLTQAFPEVPFVRIDSDTTRQKNALEEKLETIRQGKSQLLVGTQLLAKGHHFPNLTLVAIIDVDGGLYSADFRAVERMGQLITQVAGRAGRAEKMGQVVLQTSSPDNALLQKLITKGYDAFTKELLQEREKTKLPPYSHIALIHAKAKSEHKPQQFLHKLKTSLDQESFNVDIWGPIPGLMVKKQGNYRYSLMIQADNRKPLHLLLAKLHHIIAKNPLKSHVRWSLDVDPVEIR